MFTIGFLDIVHPVLQEGLTALGCNCIDFSDKTEIDIFSRLSELDGIVIRSRFPMDESFLNRAKNLKFIARSGAGMENIDIQYCESNSIELFNAPEGNRNAVGEHALGMLLSLFNNILKGNNEIRNGIWDREGNRGIELDGKVIGLIGFGNNGNAFAKKLRGFDVEVYAYDKYKVGFGTDFVTESYLEEIFEKADIVSFHIPQNEETLFMGNKEFFKSFKKDIFVVNLSRGKIIETSALVDSLESGKVLGACLDVLEFEKSSFENIFGNKNMNSNFKYLLNSENVILSPHVGGWTKESYFKLSEVLLKKIENHFFCN